MNLTLTPLHSFPSREGQVINMKNQETKTKTTVAPGIQTNAISHSKRWQNKDRER